MENVSLQEAEIISIEHKRESKELLLMGKLQLGVPCQLTFQGVEWWELCSFGVQNVLSSLEEYDEHSLTEALIEDQDIPLRHVQSIRGGDCRLFVVNASIGLSGWIVAASIQVDVVA